MSRPPMPFGMMRPPGIAMGMPPGYPMPPGMMPQQQRGGRGPKDPMQDMMERQRFPWPNTFCKRFANMQEFEIMGPLGKGGFSEVFKGRCRRDGRIYAIKKVNLSVINVHDYEIIRDEVAIHSTLNNPGVVQFFDWMKEGDFIYIILEYVEGCTLFEYLNKHHPLPESFIKNIMKQILTALQYVHNQGVIHKDLKPENVLLDKQLNAKICDFGWAERKKAVNISDDFSGTIVYMAPEILKLEQYDQAVDVWTLGVLLYELFHNIEPFKGENPQMILNSILHSPLQFDKRCPKEARDLIKYVLNIDKNYRPKVGQMLNHQFFRDTPNQSTGMPQQGQGAYGQGQQQGGSFKFMAPVQNQPAPSVQAVGGYPGQFGNQGQQLGGIGQRVSAPVGSNPIVAANGNPSSTTNVPANAFQKQPAVQQINGVNSTPKTGLSPYGGALGFGYSTGNLPQAQAIQTGPRTVSTNQLTNLRGENNKAPDHYVPIMKANKDMTSPTNATGALQLGGNIQRPQQTPTQTQAQPGALRLNNQPGGTNLPPQYKQATNTFGQSPVAQAIVNAQQPTSFGQYPQQNQQNQQNQPNNGSIQIKSRPN